MKVDVILKENDILVKSILDYNFKCALEYSNALEESDEYGLALGSTRFFQRYKDLFGEHPKSEDITLRLNDKVSMTLSDLMKTIDQRTLVNASSQIEFIVSRSTFDVSLLRYEAQKFRKTVWENDKIDVSTGKCYSLAKHLGGLCQAFNIPGVIAEVPRFHSVLIVDGICIDGSWYDGYLFKTSALCRASRERDLDELETSDYTIYSIPEFIEKNTK